MSSSQDRDHLKQKNPVDLYRLVIAGRYKPIEDSVPKEIRDLTDRMLQFNPDNRPTAKKLFDFNCPLDDDPDFVYSDYSDQSDDSDCSGYEKSDQQDHSNYFEIFYHTDCSGYDETALFSGSCASYVNDNMCDDESDDFVDCEEEETTELSTIDFIGARVSELRSKLMRELGLQAFNELHYNVQNEDDPSCADVVKRYEETDPFAVVLMEELVSYE